MRPHMTPRDPTRPQRDRPTLDRAQTCFADARVSLAAHFRCVPSVVAFSNEAFYHGRLQPRRLPPPSQRLDPPVLDILVPNGARRGKVNPAEAAALVEYLKRAIAEGGELRNATVGIISLAGIEQARPGRALTPLAHVQTLSRALAPNLAWLAAIEQARPDSSPSPRALTPLLRPAP
eukprot:6754099-Prymnesium_polylepis.1